MSARVRGARRRARAGRPSSRFGSGQIDCPQVELRRRARRRATPVPMPTRSVNSWRCRCGSQPPLTSRVAEPPICLAAPRRAVARLAAASCDRWPYSVKNGGRPRSVAQDHDAAVVDARRRISLPSTTPSSGGAAPARRPGARRRRHVDGAPLARDRRSRTPRRRTSRGVSQVARRAGRSSSADHVRRRRQPSRATTTASARRRHGARSRRRRGSGSARARPPRARAARRAPDRLLGDQQVLVLGRRGAAGDGMRAPTSRAACGSGRTAAPARPAQRRHLVVAGDERQDRAHGARLALHRVGAGDRQPAHPRRVDESPKSIRLTLGRRPPTSTLCSLASLWITCHGSSSAAAAARGSGAARRRRSPTAWRRVSGGASQHVPAVRPALGRVVDARERPVDPRDGAAQLAQQPGSHGPASAHGVPSTQLSRRANWSPVFVVRPASSGVPAWLIARSWKSSSLRSVPGRCSLST